MIPPDPHRLAEILDTARVWLEHATGVRPGWGNDPAIPIILVRELTDQLEQVRALSSAPSEQLTNLIADIKEAFGASYQAHVDEASGDISVNTAFKLALHEERYVAKDRIEHAEAALVQAQQERERLRAGYRGELDAAHDALITAEADLHAAQQARAEALKERVEAGAVIEAIEAALKGEPVSDFMESFPVVRAATDAVHYLKYYTNLATQLEAALAALRAVPAPPQED